MFHLLRSKVEKEKSLSLRIGKAAGRPWRSRHAVSESALHRRIPFLLSHRVGRPELFPSDVVALVVEDLNKSLVEVELHRAPGQ
jgi:hypothetical protein